MHYLIGVVISLLGVIFSVLHLKQNAEVYLDVIAIAVVLGGTVAVAIMTLPWEYRREIKFRLRELFLGRPRDMRELAMETMNVIRAIENKGGSPKVIYPGLAGAVLRDGIEMIDLGFSAQKIHPILEERIHQASEDSYKIANAFRSLAKYPPAFGLIGTVLSLVSVMRAISTGGSAQETGTRMAVALVATLYGLLLANLLVSPAGESILKSATEDRKEADLALQGVLLAAEKVSLLEAQEMLNSFLPVYQRINLLSSASESEPTSEKAGAA